MSNYDYIPQELKEQNIWILRDQEKRPYHAITHQLVNPIAKDNWSAYSIAIANCNGYGLGIGLPRPLCGIDIDNCIINGQPDERAVKLIDRFNSYTELSPSGRGIRILIKGVKHSKKDKFEICEIYQDNHYVTITGKHINGTPNFIMERQQELDDLIKELTPAAENPKDEVASEDDNLAPYSYRIKVATEWLNGLPGAEQGKGADAYCFAVACKLVHGYALNELAEPILYDWGQRDDQLDSRGSWYPWSIKEIHHKIQSALHKSYEGARGSCLSGWHNDYEEEVNAIIKPVEIRKLPYKLLKWSEFVDKYSAVDCGWIVEGLLPAVGVTLFSGAPFSGKTHLVEYMIGCIIENDLFLGKYATTRVPVIFHDYDYKETIRLRNLPLYGSPEALEEWFRHTDRDTLPAVLSANVLAQIITQPSLVIIDTLRAGLFGDLDSGAENDAVTMTNKLKPFRELAHQKRSAIMVLHHNNRTKNEFAGSATIQGLTEASWNYIRDEGSNLAALYIKTRFCDQKPIATEFENGQFVIRDIKEQIDTFLALMELGKEYTVQELVDLSKLSPATVSRRLNAAKQNGGVNNGPKRGKADTFIRIQ